ncbi:MAG: glutaredoxin family protein [bacterium]|nr:glutaredoxin family protein [bacterium]MDE0600661.1 glutaredoxin family protein [bacterium]
MQGRGRHLVFYTRPECHLCAVAAPRVRRAALFWGLALQEVNIDRQPDMAVDYGLRIPVVEDPAGRVLAEGEIGTLALWRAAFRVRFGRSGR